MIDTAEKRISAAGLPFMPLPFVTQNASKDAQWRQQAVGTYSGITADPPPAAGSGPYAYEAGGGIYYDLRHGSL